MRYSLVRTNGEAFLTVFPETGDPLPARSDHPNWDKLVAGVLADDESVLDLFDVSKSIIKKLDRLSERVSIYGGAIYFDGDLIDNALTEQILRFIDEDVDDWEPLVDFFEKLMTNPIEHSREQLYRFMQKNGITITEDGDVIFYKGVQLIGTDAEGNKEYFSSSAGHAFVDGVEVNGQVPNNIGSVIEMPRSEVQHDPSSACSTGLHCATFNFAKSFCNGAVLEIHVNPRDVVSVPNYSSDKVRVCRYYVHDQIDQPYTTAVKRVQIDNAPDGVYAFEEDSDY